MQDDRADTVGLLRGSLGYSQPELLPDHQTGEVGVLAGPGAGEELRLEPPAGQKYFEYRGLRLTGELEHRLAGGSLVLDDGEVVALPSPAHLVTAGQEEGELVEGGELLSGDKPLQLQQPAGALV